MARPSPRQVREQIIAQRRGTPQRAAEREVAEKVRDAEFSTIEEAEKIYAGLPKDVARRVEGVEAVKREQEKRLENISEKIKTAQEKLQKAKERYDRDRDRARERYRRDRDRGRDMDRARERYDRDRDRARERYRRDRAYYRDEIKGYQEGKSMLEEGKIIDTKEIIRFARDKGRASERQERARLQRQAARREYKKQVEQKASELRETYPHLTKEGAEKLAKEGGRVPPTVEEMAKDPGAILRGGVRDIIRGVSKKKVSTTEPKTFGQELFPGKGEGFMADIYDETYSPYVEKRQIDEIKGTPVFDTFVVDPFTQEERRATAEERELLTPVRTTTPIKSKVPRFVGESIGWSIAKLPEQEIFQEELRKPAGEVIESFTERITKVSTKPLRLAGIDDSEIVRQVSGTAAGVGIRATELTTREVGVLGAITVGGFGVGGVIKGVGVGSKALIGKTLGASAAAKAATAGTITLKTAQTGVVGYLGYKTAKTAYKIEDPIERGRFIAETGAIVSAAYTGAKLGSKAVAYATDPIKIRTPTRKPLDPFTKEVGIKAYDPTTEKMLKVSDFKIIGEKRPPIRIETTTKFRQALGFRPKAVKTLPSRPYVVRPTKAVVGEVTPKGVKWKPYKAKIDVKGFKAKQYVRVEGDAIKFDPKTAKFTRLDDYTFKKTFGDIKFYDRSLRFSKAELEVKDLGKWAVKSGDITGRLPKLGKTITRFQQMIQTQKVYDSPKIEGFKFKLGTKDITKTFPRATGKVPKMKGELIEWKKVFTKPSKDIMFRPKTISRTKPIYTKTGFTEGQLKQLQMLDRAIVPKPPVPKTKVPKTITQIEATSSQQIKQISIAALSSKEAMKSDTEVKSDIDRATMSEVSPRIITDTEASIKAITATDLDTVQAVKTVPRTKQVSKSITALKTATKTVTIPKMVTAPVQIPKSFYIQITKPPITPPGLPPGLPFLKARPRRKPRRRKPTFKEPLLYPAGFTAKSLGITQEVTEKQLQKMALSESRALGIRAVPRLKNNKRKRRSLSLIN